MTDRPATTLILTVTVRAERLSDIDDDGMAEALMGFPGVEAVETELVRHDDE